MLTLLNTQLLQPQNSLAALTLEVDLGGFPETPFGLDFTQTTKELASCKINDYTLILIFLTEE